ncbi:hypothetical protein [Methylophilus luteus]|uniref:Uncharacterized protein n=1 Tax=Methylophilus luteus TaxID=640108 RepID=A0ABW3F7Y9_9PROT
MSHAQSSSEYVANEVSNGISLASVTVGVVAAALFLLVSSYLSNETSWNIPSDRAWVSTSLTGNDLSANAWPAPASEPLPTLHPQPHKQLKSAIDEAAHFSDALYSADFMNSSAEPT